MEQKSFKLWQNFSTGKTRWRKNKNVVGMGKDLFLRKRDSLCRQLAQINRQVNERTVPNETKKSILSYEAKLFSQAFCVSSSHQQYLHISNFISTHSSLREFSLSRPSVGNVKLNIPRTRAV